MDQSVIWIPKCTEGGRSPISEIFLNFATFLLLLEKEICFEWLEEQTLTHVFGDFFGAVPTIYCGGGGGEDGSKILAFSADPLGRLPYCEMYEST